MRIRSLAVHDLDQSAEISPGRSAHVDKRLFKTLRPLRGKFNFREESLCLGAPSVHRALRLRHGSEHVTVEHFDMTVVNMQDAALRKQAQQAAHRFLSNTQK